MEAIFGWDPILWLGRTLATIVLLGAIVLAVALFFRLVTVGKPLWVGPWSLVLKRFSGFGIEFELAERTIEIQNALENEVAGIQAQMVAMQGAIEHLRRRELADEQDDRERVLEGIPEDDRGSEHSHRPGEEGTRRSEEEA